MQDSVGSEQKEPEALGMLVARACDPGIKAEAGGLLQVQGQAGYILRPCLIKQKQVRAREVAQCLRVLAAQAWELENGS